MNYRDLLIARKIGKNQGKTIVRTETVIKTETIKIGPETALGCPCVLENCVGEPAEKYLISGNTVQDGTPSPHEPAPLRSVGDFANIFVDDGIAAAYRIDLAVENEGGEKSAFLLTYTREPLRKVGDFADELENGTVTRRIKEIVLDGSEVWTVGDENDRGLINFKTVLADFPLNGTALCDCLPVQRTSIANTTDEGIMINSNNLYVRKRKSEVPDVEAFRQWLQFCPLTVQYILQNPTVEAVEKCDIPTFEGTTIISSDCLVEPSDMEVTYTSKRVKIEDGDTTSGGENPQITVLFDSENYQKYKKFWKFKCTSWGDTAYSFNETLAKNPSFCCEANGYSMEFSGSFGWSTEISGVCSQTVQISQKSALLVEYSSGSWGNVMDFELAPSADFESLKSADFDPPPLSSDTLAILRNLASEAENGEYFLRLKLNFNGSAFTIKKIAILTLE